MEIAGRVASMRVKATRKAAERSRGGTVGIN